DSDGLVSNPRPVVERGTFAPGVDYARVGSCCKEPNPVTHSPRAIDVNLKDRVEGDVDIDFLGNIDCGGWRRMLERPTKDQAIRIIGKLSLDPWRLLANL